MDACTVPTPKIYMRGTKVHFEGIGNSFGLYNDEIVIEYNTLIEMLDIMRVEQQFARRN